MKGIIDYAQIKLRETALSATHGYEVCHAANRDFVGSHTLTVRLLIDTADEDFDSHIR